MISASTMDKFDIPPFKFKQMPPNEVREEWTRYKRNFEYMALANAVTNKTRLKHIFLARAGVDVQDVFSSIPDADVEERLGVDPFRIAINKLDEYFAPKQHEAYQRFLFWSQKMKDGESLDKFMLRAMDLASKCNFGNTQQEARDISVIDKVIQMAPDDLREKLLQKEHLSVDSVTKTVNAYQSVKFQAGQMAGHSNQPKPFQEVNVVNNDAAGAVGECSRCGYPGHFHYDERCPARDRTCKVCGNVGHFGIKCRSRKARKRKFNGPTGQRKRVKFERVRAVDTEEEGKSTDFIFTIGDGDELIWVTLGGIVVQMLIDSGCEKNIVDSGTWDKLKNQGVSVSDMRTDSRVNFRAYGHTDPLKVSRVFEASIAVGDNGERAKTMATFYVVEGGQQPLLGRATAKVLGVLVLGLPSTRPPELYQMSCEQKRPFPKIKGVKVVIPIDPTVSPVAQHARRPPLALLDKIECKIDSLLASDIIEPVEEYSPWVSPLVAVLKDNGEIRLCVDMRRANLAIKRESHLMPTFEDFLPRLKEARVFSRLDIKDAFHQLELDESCRQITTFISHKGMFRYKRLMFGLSNASEVFQKIVEQMLAGCPNAMNYIDDILVYGKNEEEHDAALAKVMDKLKAKNVLLNHKKCIFRVSEVVFLGHHISGTGIRPAEEKLSALKSFRAPQTVEELRSFLGLVTYVGRFLPDLATATAALRKLTHAGEKFRWEQEHENAFQKVKRLICDLKTLRYFDNKLRTRVIADASPVGLGAVLVQFTDYRNDSEVRVIGYASKSLSPTEKRYCQTEKEALALVWAVERFSVYLLGRHFELETDHKPLEIIFSPSSSPCPRIERWVLRLQAYRFAVKYRKGSSNIADPFSRLCTLDEGVDFDSDSKFLVLAIAESAAIDTNELERASQGDGELAAVRECVRSGVWNQPDAKPYERFQGELGVLGESLLVRGSKLVVPRALRPRMLDLGHEGHPGETVMKRRLRDRVWWPNMDGDIVKHVTGCEGCRLIGLPSKPEPMCRRELPTKPWVDVAIDFLGPLPSGEYLLVIVDYYSRYKEIEVMKHITAEETTKRLHRIFTRLGFPVTITLDNGRQFVSTHFDHYCKQHGISLNYSTPYWPQENGLVERQNRSLIKRLQISHALGRDWKEDLAGYLLMYYTTPHSTTGKTPTELCYGRTIRSKIPSLIDVESTPNDEDFRERDRLLKQKGKELEDKKRHARPSDLQPGDTVLMKNVLPGNKLTTAYSPKEHVVLSKEGGRVTVQDKESRKVYKRNVTHLKRVPSESSVAGSVEAPQEDPVPPVELRPSPIAEEAQADNHFRNRREVKRPTRFRDYIVSHLVDD